MSNHNPYFVVDLVNRKLVKRSPACSSVAKIQQWCKENDHSLQCLGSDTALRSGISYGFYMVSQSFMKTFPN